MEEEKLIEELGKLRRDQYKPWRYIWFTFLNGIAQGIGIALGTTLVLGIVIYLVTIILSQLVNFPVLGSYFSDIIKMINAYTRHGPRVR